MLLSPVDHGKDNLAARRHADSAARCAPVADVARELLLACRHVHASVLDETWSRTDDLHGTIPHRPRLLSEHGRVTDTRPRRRERIHRRTMHGDDVAVRGNRGVIRVDLRHASLANHIFQTVRICPRRPAVGAVVDDESVLTALGIHSRNRQRDLIDLHRAVVGNRSEYKGAVGHHAEGAAVVVGRPDNCAVNLRHAEDLTV